MHVLPSPTLSSSILFTPYPFHAHELLGLERAGHSTAEAMLHLFTWEGVKQDADGKIHVWLWEV